jgi:CBS domain-containing protein
MTEADKLAVLTPEHSVLEAMDLMLRYNVRHVPVVSDEMLWDEGRAKCADASVGEERAQHSTACWMQ